METFASNTKIREHSIRYLTWEDVFYKAEQLGNKIINKWDENSLLKEDRKIKIYGIPRGGNHVAILFRSIFPNEFCIASNPEDADLLVDDIFDTGETAKVWCSRYKKKIVVLYKSIEESTWLVFPWEAIQDETAPTENVRRIITYIGDDPNREGLIETPNRVAKSWNTLFSGYHKKVEDVLKIFEDDSSDEMIILKDCEFFSQCEHHMLPFFGKAHIAYIPNGRVVGISKLARILEIFSRRLQIQERICQQITQAIMEHLHPKGAACMLEAQHFCMTSRGVQKQNSIMVTSSLEGQFKTDISTRQEFLSLIK